MPSARGCSTRRLSERLEASVQSRAEAAAARDRADAGADRPHEKRATELQQVPVEMLISAQGLSRRRARTSEFSPSVDDLAITHIRSIRRPGDLRRRAGHRQHARSMIIVSGQPISISMKRAEERGHEDCARQARCDRGCVSPRIPQRQPLPAAWQDGHRSRTRRNAYTLADRKKRRCIARLYTCTFGVSVAAYGGRSGRSMPPMSRSCSTTSTAN